MKTIFGFIIGGFIGTALFCGVRVLIYFIFEEWPENRRREKKFYEEMERIKGRNQI